MELRSPGGILSVHIIKKVLQVPFNWEIKRKFTVAALKSLLFDYFIFEFIVILWMIYNKPLGKFYFYLLPLSSGEARLGFTIK